MVRQIRRERNIGETRITTFIKAKFKKSDDKTNIDKSRVAVNITEYYSISKSIFLNHDDNAIIHL